MRDRRTVDELSIEELEEILRVRRRDARLERLRRKHESGGLPAVDPLKPDPAGVDPLQLPTEHQRYQDVGATAQFRSQVLDDRDEPESSERSSGYKIEWGWLRDKSLLVIELGVVVGLMLVFVSAVTVLNSINAESSELQKLPTLTPSPAVAAPMIDVILPGGHTPPDSPGGAVPAEIPAHLRDIVQAITPLPVPTPGPEHGTRIQIPSVGIDAPFVEGDDWESLKQGAGHHLGSANPGERGNVVVSAHNDIFGEIFRDLPDVDLGDEILVHTPSRMYRYVVTQKRVIEPTEVDVMAPTSGPVITLISCYPYGIDTHRIVVIGEIQP
ncbi:MAG: class D sortase [Anaerolineae bacterium]|nr:class D sortase [Anaerolineae bacterium]